MPPKAILHCTALGLAAGAALALSGCGAAETSAPDAGAAADATVPDAAVGPADASAVDAGPPLLMPVAERIGDTPPTDPAGRWGAWTVYAASERALYSFGGSFYPRNGVAQDTWRFDLETRTWSEITAPGGPDARYCLCATYLPDQNQILWIGGRSSRGPLPPGAWILDLAGPTWTEITDGDVPPGTIGCQAVWYPPGGYALVFGGDGSGGLISRSYAYDPAAQSFRALNLPARPPGRRDAMMAYDSNTMQVVLHGGAARIMPTNTQHFDDTWIFDGTEWTELPTTGGPPPARRWGAFAVDPLRHRFVLFSGTEETSTFEDLWSLDLASGAWTEHLGVELPPARAGAGHAFVAEEDALYLFGGLQSPDYRALDDGWRIRFGQRP